MRPPGLQYPATKGLSDAAQLENWQQLIEAAEAQWGISHPAVGRAWLELARALQAAAKDSERARQATRKAWTVCQTLMGASKQVRGAVQLCRWYRPNTHARCACAPVGVM